MSVHEYEITFIVNPTLSEEDKRQLWIPPGFAHGFLVTSDEALFVYKCTDFYEPKAELVIVKLSSHVVGAGAKPVGASSSRRENEWWPALVVPAGAPQTITCLRCGSLPSSGANTGNNGADTISACARLSRSMYS